MVKVIAKSVYKEDKVSEAKQMLGELVEKSRKEDGCLSYNLYEDMSDSSILVMVEEWKTDEDIKNHQLTEHYTRIIPALKPFRKSSEVNRYKLVF